MDIDKLKEEAFHLSQKCTCFGFCPVGSGEFCPFDLHCSRGTVENWLEILVYEEQKKENASRVVCLLQSYCVQHESGGCCPVSGKDNCPFGQKDCKDVKIKDWDSYLREMYGND